MLAAPLRVRHPLVHPEVPVHVRRLLAPAFLVDTEAAAALRAGRTEVFVQSVDEVWAAVLFEGVGPGGGGCYGSWDDGHGSGASTGSAGEKTGLSEHGE